MSEAITATPYAFMTCTGTALHLLYTVFKDFQFAHCRMY